MGDPSGIGPEICARLLAEESIYEICQPVVYGCAATLREAAVQVGVAMKSNDENNIVDLPRSAPFERGVVAADSGAAAYSYILKAIQAAKNNDVSAVVTGPIHKESLAAAGIEHPGHTEIFAEQTSTNRYCMMLTSDDITCSLVTTHVGLGDVIGLLSTHRILEVIELSHAAMTRLRNHQPRIAVCGLNPHAGEGGLFGNREEERIITPAIEAARNKGMNIVGPLPADTAFLSSQREQTDCYICMYHDQGLIPLKTLAFETAVNVTLGLPIVRTSVDHGTGFDIAWQGKANPTSLFCAVRLACRLCESSPATQASNN